MLKWEECLVQDAEVAVIYSAGFGAGWSTWNAEYANQMMFDKGLAEIVISNSLDDQWYWKAEKYCKEKWPDAYLGGLEGLTIRWVNMDDLFIIEEYDGAEQVVLQDEMPWLSPPEPELFLRKIVSD